MTGSSNRWWQTLPGILTAIATLITAIAALVTAIYPAVTQSNRPPDASNVPQPGISSQMENKKIKNVKNKPETIETWLQGDITNEGQ